MAKIKRISAERARQLLDYDPNIGVLTWKPRTPDMFGNSNRFSAETQCKRWNTRYAGTIAGHPTEKGYLHVHVGSVMFSGHHLMWLIHTGEHPPYEIDHRDGDTSNNKFTNFRLAGPGDNAQNRKINRNNTSGMTGVCWIAAFKKWKAIFASTYLGLFDSADEAQAVYLAEKRKRHRFQPHPRYLPEVDTDLSDATREKICVPGKRRKASAETREKIRQSRLGTHLSVETKAKIGAASKGNTYGILGKGVRRSAETKARMSAAQKGHSVSPETCAKISAALKNRHRSKP